ncbi:MAG TPA: cytochrome c-type biogenesis protein CcmH [Gaiellaceae bacterium]|nr:cytochrome c-type biogenesis protein CcmH [Gaiellaceae bacterium]
MRLVVALIAALAIVPAATAACRQPKTTLSALESQVMCPICHTTLDQSQSGAANQIRAIIRAKIARCESADQIKRELVADFGVSILAAPPKHGFNLVAWVLPLAGIGLAAVVLGGLAWRWSRGREPSRAPGGPALDPELDRRVDEELARFDG